MVPFENLDVGGVPSPRMELKPRSGYFVLLASSGVSAPHPHQADPSGKVYHYPNPTMLAENRECHPIGDIRARASPGLDVIPRVTFPRAGVSDEMSSDG